MAAQRIPAGKEPVAVDLITHVAMNRLVILKNGSTPMERAREIARLLPVLIPISDTPEAASLVQHLQQLVPCHRRLGVRYERVGRLPTRRPSAGCGLAYR